MIYVIVRNHAFPEQIFFTQEIAKVVVEIIIEEVN
jgi:hypothetical protein